MTAPHGATRVHWMIGAPITQVRMPALANAYFDAAGQDEVLVPIEVHPECLEIILRLYASATNVGGLISTLPHKAALATLVDTISPRAALIGMVNVVRKDRRGLVGDMLDGVALVSTLEARGIDVRDAHALVIGCGGFGSAAAYELLASGARTVELADSDPSRALALARRLGDHFGAGRACCLTADRSIAAHVLIQASPMGMRPLEGSPVDIGLVEGLEVVVEAVTGRETALLHAARLAGLAAITGNEIAQAQLPAVLDFWALSDSTSVHGSSTQRQPFDEPVEAR